MKICLTVLVRALFDTAKRKYLILSVVLICFASSGRAAEGGADLYLPGFYGDFQMAILPDQGLYYLNYFLYSQASTDTALRQGRLHLGIEDEIIANTFALLYASDKNVLGGRYFASLYMPVMYAKLDALVETGSNFESTSASAIGFGDWYAVPIGINWKHETVSISLYEGINVPLGKYDIDDPVNLGLNYWAFDTNIAFTWINEEGHLEANLNLGYIINGTNSATDYRSGNALHLDYTIGYDVSQRLSIALVGYGYKQVTGDSGTGATLGPNKGRAYGLGPAVSYTFATKTPVVLTGKWLHDLDSTNRLKGDYLYLIAEVPLQ